MHDRDPPYEGARLRAVLRRNLVVRGINLHALRATHAREAAWNHPGGRRGRRLLPGCIPEVRDRA